MLHPEMLDSLTAFPFLDLISTGARDRLRAIARPFAAGLGIYRQEGDPCAEVAMLDTGRLRVVKRRISGREVGLYTVGPGELCTLEVLAVLAETPYRAEAVIEAPVAGIALPAPLFRELVDGEPALRDHLFRTSERRLAYVLDLVCDTALGTLEERVAGLVLRLAEPGPGASAVPVTHERLAQELACTREAVSRILGGWERAGLVRLGRARLWLLDRERMSLIATGS